jgi:hypothetical protein
MMKATETLDRRLIQVLVERYPVIQQALSDEAHQIRDRLLEAQIGQALTARPGLNKADLRLRLATYPVLIPPETMVVTETLRARLREAGRRPLVREAQPLRQPALFALGGRPADVTKAPAITASPAAEMSPTQRDPKAVTRPPRRLSHDHPDA